MMIMVCWQLPDGIHIHIPKPVHLFERCDIPVFEHLYKLHENFRRCSCIIHRTVMISREIPSAFATIFSLYFDKVGSSTLASATVSTETNPVRSPDICNSAR